MFDGTCESLADIFIDESIDNVRRLEMGVPTFPAGQSWRTFVYYAQAIRTGDFTLYDYGSIKNLEKYGQKEAPPVPLQDYDIPTVLLSGDVDSRMICQYFSPQPSAPLAVWYATRLRAVKTS